MQIAKTLGTLRERERATLLEANKIKRNKYTKSEKISMLYLCNF